ncbi:YdcH family protein [Rhizobium halophytocola]|uniref:Uncharacterized protein YdcH (DUF465 family) n=1 Tax=Rhizobium halophytocola TaxID=735519 RepID=A0ABS4DWF7_9HYPH|nr:YdcH family protein [Rhizobium halophytocola]MBP1850029.1 uncharacterized protein YdcH (DUF465 family) [Rhizobium halophytocola]
MSHTPHELAAEFPQFTALMRHLRETDGHFARLCESYHAVNGEIHRAETDIAPVGDFRMEDMRKERMRLKDEIYGMLVRAEPEAELPTTH